MPPVAMYVSGGGEADACDGTKTDEETDNGPETVPAVPDA